MSRSWRIGTFWGIPLKIHWTFSLLLIYILVVGRMEGLSGMSLIWFLVLFLALFVCVILHEYGHALTARAYGVRTADILILPVGGLARLERLPEKPIQELIVAIAGPAVNLVLFSLGVAYFWISGQGWAPLADLGMDPQPNPGNLLPQLVLINAALFTFNLIPAFPMDGGRILRSVLAMMMPKTRATAWATRIGMGVSVIFMITGLATGNLVLAIVGLVVLYLAQSENRAVQMVDDIQHLTAADVMEKRILMMEDWRTVGDIKALPAPGKYAAVVVADVFGNPVGFLSIHQVVSQDHNAATPLHEACRPFDRQVAPETGLRMLITFFRTSKAAGIPVVEGGLVRGLITREQIQPYDALQQVS